MANIESISNDSIVVYVSNLGVGTNKVTVSVYEKEVSTTIESIGLQFDSIEPQPVAIGSVFTIYGRFLDNINYIYFNNGNIFFYLDIINKTSTEIQVKMTPIVEEGMNMLKISDKYNNIFELPIEISNRVKIYRHHLNIIHAGTRGNQRN